MSATITQIERVSLVDVPGILRRIADDVEAGEYGTPRRCAIALLADDFRTFYCGERDAFENAAMMHFAAAQKLTQQMIDVETPE